ncbi:MAG: putative toxin-antitoxin system toxin component, PIN family [Acidobacteria bacterium]|nr:MAG: putative toxin-antitoxin system toxin component, PIN family [Acidobacteriota bacterium]
MRVTADTNVLVSALNFPGSKPYRLLELARSGAIDLAISGHILDELEDVLRRKFNWPDGDIREMRRQFRMFAQYVVNPDAVEVITADPDDNRILEAATGSDYIVSGDHHLLDLGRFRNIPVVRVAEFIEMFERQRGGSAS